MRKLSAVALVCLACCAPEALAVEFKNVHATFGPWGAPRPAKTMRPGDLYLINFDLTGMVIDAKGIAKYEMSLEVFDPKGKQVFKDSTKKAVIAALGGTTVPETARVMLGSDQTPGKYKFVVSVTEDGAKTSKQLAQEIELLPHDFDLIFVSAPSIGFVGQDYNLDYSVVDMARDPKDKLPKLTVTTRLIDEATGKPTLPEPMVSKLPDDWPPEVLPNLAKPGRVPVQSPMYLNRPGRFKVELEIRDDITKKTLKFSYTLTVLDATGK
jgi:hypothetical protein